ncbi:hypothetical protein IJH29_01455 [Candidatus Saccharibacteria bacterium]|nr:hypothetical protein [Candidatus Saccharibacteria bacterium]
MGAPRHRRLYGNYWSSTTYSTTNSRSLSFASTRLNPSNGGLKGIGFAVRSRTITETASIVNSPEDSTPNSLRSNNEPA